MAIKQVSVFIENREGRLNEITEVLAKNEINIITFSLADTSEYGVMRMIVSEPDRAKKVLADAGFSAKVSEVIAAKVPNTVGMLHFILGVIANTGANVRYMYILSTGENASVVLKVSDSEKVKQAMLEAGMVLYEEEQVYNFRS